MSVSSLGGPSIRHSVDDSDLSDLDPELRLALLMLGNEQTQIESDRDTLKAAREQRREALKDEVKSLRDSAKDSMFAAFSGAALTVAGGALQVAGSLKASDTGRPDCALDKCGGALGSAATPIGTWLANKDGHAADQAAARGAAEGAGWRADDAKEQKQRAETRGDRVMDLAQQNLRENQSSRLALINRV